MAKAKKRVATRKKSSKRGKASAKHGRKKKRMTPKQAKSKVRGAARPMSKRQRQSKIATNKAPSKTPRQAVEVPVEDTIIDVIEKPVPGVVVDTEYETILDGSSRFV